MKEYELKLKNTLNLNTKANLALIPYDFRELSRYWEIYRKIKVRWDDLWNVEEKHDELERDYDELVLTINQDRVYNI